MAVLRADHMKTMMRSRMVEILETSRAMAQTARRMKRHLQRSQ